MNYKAEVENRFGKIFYLDNEKQISIEEELSGFQIKARSPRMEENPGWSLYEKGQDLDRIIRNEDKVKIEGKHFYLVPPAMGG